MDLSSYLKVYSCDKEKLKSFGFIDGIYKENLSSSLYALFTILDDSFFVKVYENEDDECYELFDIPSASGAFVSSIRNEVESIIKRILRECFSLLSIREKYISYLEDEYKIKGEYPWLDSPYETSCVFRCPNEKWFAVVMTIKNKCLGIPGDGTIDIVNLKIKDAGARVDNNTIYPAYHMNKKYWVSVVLSSDVSFEKLIDLTRESFSLVNTKKR